MRSSVIIWVPINTKRRWLARKGRSRIWISPTCNFCPCYPDMRCTVQYVLNISPLLPGHQNLILISQVIKDQMRRTQFLLHWIETGLQNNTWGAIWTQLRSCNALVSSTIQKRVPVICRVMTHGVAHTFSHTFTAAPAAWCVLIASNLDSFVLIILVAYCCDKLA